MPFPHGLTSVNRWSCRGPVPILSSHPSEFSLQMCFSLCNPVPNLIPGSSVFSAFRELVSALLGRKRAVPDFLCAGAPQTQMPWDPDVLRQVPSRFQTCVLSKPPGRITRGEKYSGVMLTHSSVPSKKLCRAGRPARSSRAVTRLWAARAGAGSRTRRARRRGSETKRLLATRTKPDGLKEGLSSGRCAQKPRCPLHLLGCMIPETLGD